LPTAPVISSKAASAAPTKNHAVGGTRMLTENLLAQKILRYLATTEPTRDDGLTSISNMCAELEIPWSDAQKTLMQLYNEEHLLCEQRNIRGYIKNFRLVKISPKGTEAVKEAYEESKIQQFFEALDKEIVASDLPGGQREGLASVMKTLSYNSLINALPGDTFPNLLRNALKG
jgi:hypothetical protein